MTTKISQRVLARIVRRRERGDTTQQIAQYVGSTAGSFGLDIAALDLTEAETLAFHRLVGNTLPQRIARDREAAKRAKDSLTLPPPPAPTKRRSLVNGWSPTKVWTELDCTVAEFDRWAADGRLKPDGERYYHGVGPLGGGKWGRCWLPETVEAARPHLESWRGAGGARKRFARAGLSSISPDGAQAGEALI